MADLSFVTQIYHKDNKRKYENESHVVSLSDSKTDFV